MATRLLVMFSLMVLELGLGIAAILGVVSSYGRYQRVDEGGAAGCVMIIVGIIVFWLMTIALFVRKSSRESANRLITQAKVEAARILSDAAEKSLALCNLDGGKCRKCGNPRTGKFCPKCGANGEPAEATNRDLLKPEPMLAVR